MFHLVILLLTETWFMQVVTPDAIIKDVAPPECRQSGTKKKGGGVTFITRDGIKVSRLKLNCKPKTFENLAVRLVVCSRRFNVAGVYRPPKSSSVTEFTDELSTVPQSHPLLRSSLMSYQPSPKVILCYGVH